VVADVPKGLVESEEAKAERLRIEEEARNIAPTKKKPDKKKVSLRSLAEEDKDIPEVVEKTGSQKGGQRIAEVVMSDTGGSDVRTVEIKTGSPRVITSEVKEFDRAPETKEADSAEYYATQLVGDLKIIYPERNEVSASPEAWNGAKERIKKFHIKWLTKPSDRAGSEGKPVRRFEDGRRMTLEIQKYLNLETEEPLDWKENTSLISESRVNLEDLREARRMLLQKGEHPADEKQTSADSLLKETASITNIGIVDKAELRISDESSFVDPVPALKILGNVPMNESMRQQLGDLRFGDAERLAAVRRLISRGYNLNVIGVDTKVDVSTLGIVYSKDLGGVEGKKIQKLIAEIQRQSENYDIASMSKDLKVFLGNNLEKFYKWMMLYGEIKKRLGQGHGIDEETGTKEGEKNDNLVWYDGILGDIVAATVLGTDPARSEEIRQYLIRRGADIPSISFDPSMEQAYQNRQWLRNAAELLLSDKEVTYPYKLEGTSIKWENREQIVEWLKRMKIREGGVPYLPDSEEAKGMKAVEARPVVESKENKKVSVENMLIQLSELVDEGAKEPVLASLEAEGIKIRKFLTDMEKAAPGKSKDLMMQLRAVVEVWRMSEAKRAEFPAMTKIAGAYARLLGLG